MGYFYGAAGQNCGPQLSSIAKKKDYCFGGSVRSQRINGRSFANCGFTLPYMFDRIQLTQSTTKICFLDTERDLHCWNDVE